MTLYQKTDIIIFGATGFTGKRVIPHLAKFSNEQNLTWGVAGRSKEKLLQVLKEYQSEIEISPEAVSTIIADVSDFKALNEMMRQCRVVINCCGPFRLYGEAVVKACVENGTHYVDISGETQFIEKMQLKYHKEAQNTNCYIISACAGESIPNDMGVQFLEKNFKGTVNSIESYLELSGKNPSISWANFSFGSWESMVHYLHNIREVTEIRDKLWPIPLPKLTPKLKLKVLPHKIENKWAAPFDGTDLAIVRRSQRFFYENSQKRPIQFETYLILNSFANLLRALFFGAILLVLSRFACGVNLLLKYPRFFSNGLVTTDNPTEEEIQNNLYRIILYAEGWNENSENKTSIVEIKGSNMGYGDTCKFVSLSAITILQETDKLPQGGGVLPPGYAFANTSLTEQLIKTGLIISVKQI